LLFVESKVDISAGSEQGSDSKREATIRICAKSLLFRDRVTQAERSRGSSRVLYLDSASHGRCKTARAEPRCRPSPRIKRLPRDLVLLSLFCRYLRSRHTVCHISPGTYTSLHVQHDRLTPLHHRALTGRSVPRMPIGSERELPRCNSSSRLRYPAALQPRAQLGGRHGGCMSLSCYQVV
jgi:hypothetical protein